MATVQTLPALLATLKTSVESAIPILPDEITIQPPTNGISLLDVKTELLLSYLQNLVFLVLVKLRKHSSADDGREIAIAGSDGARNANDECITAAVNKLVELRVYLEKGVRPLEGRLKYQIDKVLAAADNAIRNNASNASEKPRDKSQKKMSKTKSRKTSGSGSDASDASNASGSFSSSSSGEDDGDSDAEDEIDELAYRPNPAAFAVQPNTSTHNNSQSTTSKRSNASSTTTKDAPYRPPRINPTSLPTTDTFESRNASSRKPKPLRSHAIDDYVTHDLSTAPVLETNIGSTITAGGRSTRTVKERAKDAERREYEETNFVRLPKEVVGKGKGGKRRNDRGGAMEDFSLSGLGEVGDRVVKATANRGKRGRDTVDGVRGDGYGSGTFAIGGGKKRKVRR